MSDALLTIPELPARRWPSDFPACRWKSLVFFTKENGAMALDLGHLPWPTFIKGLFEEWTLSHRALLSIFLGQQISEDGQRAKHPQVDDNLLGESDSELLTSLGRLSQQALWNLAENKLSPSELFPIHYFLKDKKETQDFSQWIVLLFQSQGSRTIKIKILEYAIDLILMNRLSVKELQDQFSETSKSLDQHHKSIMRLRFPETTLNENQKQQELRSLNVPVGCRLTQKREGDKSLLQMTVTAQDIPFLLSRLQNTVTTLKKHCEES